MRAILERDFLFETSRARTVVLRTLLAAVLAAGIVVVAGASSAQFRQRPDEVGRVLFWTGAGMMLGALALLTPPLVVGSVLAERQQETLPLVLATPVGSGGFAAAKMISRIAVVLFLALAALPALTLSLVFGGVAAGQVGDLVTLAAAVTIELAAWSLWFSTVSRRLATAVVLSFLVPAARWIAVMFTFVWVMDGEGARDLHNHLLPVLGGVATIPFPGLVEVMAPGEYATIPTYTGAPLATSDPVLSFLIHHPAQAYLVFAILAAVAATLSTAQRLRTEAEPKEGWFRSSRFGRRWFRQGSPGVNPVTWKERRLLNTAGSRPLFYGVLALMVLAEAFGLPTVFDRQESLVLLTAQLVLLCLVAAVSGAAILGQERTQGSYDLLRASLLRPGEILRGKAAGVLTGTALLGGIPLIHVVLSVWFEGIDAMTGLVAVLLLALVPWGWAAFGMATASHAPRIRTAVVRTMGGFIGCFVGMPAFGFAMDYLDILGRTDAAFFSFGSPPAYFFAVLLGVDRGYYDFYATREFRYGLIWAFLYVGFSLWLTLTLRRRLVRALEEDRKG